MSKLLVVSADEHVGFPAEDYRPYLEKRFHPNLADLRKEEEVWASVVPRLRVLTEEDLAQFDPQGIYRDGLRGTWNLDQRLIEMNREGVAAAFVIGGVADFVLAWYGPSNHPAPADLRAAGARAYHRLVADRVLSGSGGRLFGVAESSPTTDMDAAVKELRWVARNGFRAVMIPKVVDYPDLPPLWDRYFDPFWRACVELSLPLVLHAGHGRPPGEVGDFLRGLAKYTTQSEMREAMLQRGGGSPFDLDYIPAQVMWSLMLGGVFDRFPELKFILTEVRADWVPATLRVLDDRFQAGGTPLKKSPSEYWRSNCWATCSSIKHSEVLLRQEIGLDRMMFARDYPHSESTWPNTWDWLRDAANVGGLDEHELRELVGGTACDVFDLDRDFLEAIAARIGPSVSDILGGHQVDPGCLSQMWFRAGVDKSYADIDAEAIDRMFRDDLTAFTTAASTVERHGSARDFKITQA